MHHIKKISILIIFSIISINIITIISSSQIDDLPSKMNEKSLTKTSIEPFSNNVRKTSEGSISCGVSTKKITPDLSKHNDIYLAGFDRNRKATGIHDDLWSRCCFLKIGNNSIAIVTVDLIGIMYHEYLSILERLPQDIEIDLLLLSSTHNHEGPDVIGLWGSGFKSGINWNWYEETINLIVDGIVEAYENMKPAGLTFGHTEAIGFSRDSRKPITMEEQVETIQVVNVEEKPITTLVFYTSHPEVLWNKNTLITADYPNYLYQYIEENNGGTGLLVTGPIGGLITPNVESHNFDNAKLFGEAIAELSLSSIQNTSIIWETSVSTEIRNILVPLTNPIFRFASCINVLDRPLYYFGSCLISAVSVIEIGERGNLAQIITVPGEDFPENWFEIKDKLHGKHKIHIGLCMDELGYIVPIEEFNITEYEESMSASKYLDPIIHNALEEMLTIL